MIPDPGTASAYLSADFELVLTGGRRFAGPAQSAAFNAKRYAWVRTRFLRTDAALVAETGDVHVYNTGYLCGEWHDGTAFQTNRCTDKFIVRNGKLIRTAVWNDSAEILLARAGLAEADGPARLALILDRGKPGDAGFSGQGGRWLHAQLVLGRTAGLAAPAGRAVSGDPRSARGQ